MRQGWRARRGIPSPRPAASRRGRHQGRAWAWITAFSRTVDSARDLLASVLQDAVLSYLLLRSISIPSPPLHPGISDRLFADDGTVRA